MKVCCIQLITLSCMVRFQNCMAKHFVAYKDHIASLKFKVAVQTFAVNKP